MGKSEAVTIVMNCAALYHANLENKNLMFVFGSTNKKEYFEVEFLPRHFYHLTGLKYRDEDKGESVRFYNECVEQRLSSTDISFKDQFTEQNLSILPSLMRIHEIVNMTGDYNFTYPLLYTDKLAGSVKACMGLVREDNGFYSPNTALRVDIRDVTYKGHKVIATYKKSSTQDKYVERTFLGKGITLDTLKLPKEILDKLDSSLYPEIYQESLSEKFSMTDLDRIYGAKYDNELKNKDVHSYLKEDLER